MNKNIEINKNVNQLKQNLEEIIQYIKNNQNKKEAAELIDKIIEEIPYIITLKSIKENNSAGLYVVGEVLYNTRKELEKQGYSQYY